MLAHYIKLSRAKGWEEYVAHDLARLEKIDMYRGITRRIAKELENDRNASAKTNADAASDKAIT